MRQNAWDTIRTLPPEIKTAIAVVIRGSDVTAAGDPDDIETRLNDLADRIVDEALSPWERQVDGSLLHVG